jgi:hypothetical protein
MVAVGLSTPFPPMPFAEKGRMGGAAPSRRNGGRRAGNTARRIFLKNLAKRKKISKKTYVLQDIYFITLHAVRQRRFF